MNNSVPDGGIVYQVAKQRSLQEQEQIAFTARLMAYADAREGLTYYVRKSREARADVSRSTIYLGSCVISLAPEGWMLKDRLTGELIPCLTQSVAFREASRREYQRGLERRAARMVKVSDLLVAVTNGTYCPASEEIADSMMRRLGGEL